MRLAAAALADVGLEPAFIGTGGGADTNVFNARGLPAVNLGVGLRERPLRAGVDRPRASRPAVRAGPRHRARRRRGRGLTPGSRPVLRGPGPRHRRVPRPPALRARHERQHGDLVRARPRALPGLPRRTRRRRALGRRSRRRRLLRRPRRRRRHGHRRAPRRQPARAVRLPRARGAREGSTRRPGCARPSAARTSRACSRSRRSSRCSGASRRPGRSASATWRCSSCSTAAACAPPSCSACATATSTSRAASCAASARATRSASCRWAARRRRRSARYLRDGRRTLQRGRRRPELFLNARGGPLTRQGLDYLLRRYLRKAGLLGRASTHTFRHSFATHLLAGGADLRSVQEMLGHANVATTQLYTHVTVEHLREVFLETHPRARRRRGAGDVPTRRREPARATGAGGRRRAGVTRVFVCVLDGVGAGELPDAAAYGDVGSSTLAARARADRRARCRTSPASAWARSSARCAAPTARTLGRRAPRRPTAACSSAAPARTRPPATGR